MGAVATPHAPETATTSASERGTGYPARLRCEARDDDEDRSDGGERELEPGVEQGVRVPGEQDRRSDEEEVPAVLRPRREPGQRRERSRHTRAHDRGLPPDREHVAADRRQRGDLTDEPGQADEPRDGKRAAGDEHDVLARDGQQVVEARRAKPGAELVRQALVLAEDDPGDHRTALAVNTGRHRARELGPQPICESGDPAAVADDAPARRRHDDVHAVAAQPGALVEAVLGPARKRGSRR